ncbi:MAG: hypothetical protein A2504_13720 [Bdellovibrionales bacterium RIFOXYD12_FULL_39_22]|nr:MAG: hypothetical protein A2385_00445 [Bdellovibrionales bacterium RIFOXYB1_FULL_39_21]OFZ43854.1 MAG: hypothetical protein A2485_05085 [Bdellovibrionales bacterium RIFOXYC12_FULL_39_17]OFZ48812.1 MAG: hypothetical protein A2404_17760 [Bdellovibrionales bacterium RIFOXYC1_FULL_39_130]OFZ71503.1 MAG: hypothetical protein A2451_00205 [Bdellovibrionales bacterium RIFOXYC2_FULL_39_8]OFZ76545.1 MAG: hypothetical protein A2560_06425 [Bdellovibrionales bacterium RIFOXYD1_FULL_39_84]OFZ94779.1 MAG:
MKITSFLIILILNITLFSCGPKVVNQEDLLQEQTQDLGQSCGKISQKVIYGSDDRHEFFQSSTKIQHLSRSVGALVSTSRLRENLATESFSFFSASYGDSYNLCSSEPYRAQDSLAFCSSFLIAPDIMVTAGHCVLDAADCDEISVLFDYAIASSTADQTGPKVLSEDSVYSCERILYRSTSVSGVDYTIFRLDRPVLDRLPLKLRQNKNGSVAPDDRVSVLGYPMGLPFKADTNGSVRGVASSYFISNLDSYGGNSGSPIINNMTLEVEGLLISGEEDLVANSSATPVCYESKKCPVGGCSGEWATKITALPSAIYSFDIYEQGSSANDCRFANDGVCDDGRTGASYAACDYGTDENDCEKIETDSAETEFSCQL